MNKAELKRILKPLIKECIKEVIFEEGTLSTIISEVVKSAPAATLITEQRVPKQRLETTHEAQSRRKKNLETHKKKMLDAIGRDSYNGVNLFEGTTPMSSRPSSTTSPHGSKALDGIAPNDSGVDLSGFGMASGIWKKLAGN